MLKVKEYLDRKFKGDPDNHISGKGVFGEWCYPHDDNLETNNERFMDGLPPKDRIVLSINNETIIVARIVINGKFCSKYHYLQTYKHIPRGEPDQHGYYARSTDEEVINYIDGYLQELIKVNKLDRKNKINKILNRDGNI